MKLDYGFAKTKGSGSAFLRNQDIVAYFPNKTSYYFGVFKLNKFDEPTKIIDSFINWDFSAVTLGKQHAILKNKKNAK